MKKTDEKYQFYNDNYLVNIEMLNASKGLIDEALESKDMSKLSLIPSVFAKKEFVMTSEVNRILNVLSIYISEKGTSYEDCYFNDINSYEKLYEKYLKTILMLRRVEQDADGDFSLPAYEYIGKSRISPYAIIVILEKEYYERRDYILQTVFRMLSAGISDREKFEWLICLNEKYGKAEYALELASLYLKYGESKLALGTLNKLKGTERTAEIISIIEELNGAFNE